MFRCISSRSRWQRINSSLRDEHIMESEELIAAYSTWSLTPSSLLDFRKGTPEDASESVRTRSLYTAYSYHEETVESCQENWRDPESSESGPAIVTPYGTISLRLHERVRVDMTIDRAVRIINHKNNIVICLSGCGSAAALLHPNGRVYQYGSRVEIMAHDSAGNNKYAKMWYKGVSFTSEQCALVYLVDAAGTRTTTDNFCDMGQDFSLPVFYNDSRHGPSYFQEAVSILQSSQYWVTEEGIENWIVNNVRVSQTQDGLVRYETLENMAE